MEEKEENITISARTLEEVLLRFLGSYLVIKQLILLLPGLLLLPFALRTLSVNLIQIANLSLPLFAGIFLIAVPGKWISFTRFLRK